MEDKKYDMFLDFDGTSANSVKRLVRIFNKKFRTNHDWRYTKEYNLTDLFPSLTHKNIIEVFDNDDFFDDLELFDGFLEVIHKFEKHFNYYIATIGTPNNLINKKIYCCDNFDFKYEYKPIQKDGTGKNEIDMSNGILIDDHIDNLRNSNAKIKILFKNGMDTNWNKIDLNKEEDRQFMVADSWFDVESILDFVLSNKLLEV